ncbi:Alpha/Beta hydrolase protein [Sporodiniella umbellata]|nr:Alpha/Beta hydrolase protein [Sporodiniella umbellata]
MIPDSALTRGLIYALALLQSTVAPVAFISYIYYVIVEQHLFELHRSIDTFIHYWLGCELMFYIYFQITRNRMQRTSPHVAPTAQERNDLYNLCLSNIDEAELWISGWFASAGYPDCPPKFKDIFRDNVAEWISWAFFNLPLEHAIEDPSLYEELEYMIDRFENNFKINFKEGYNENIVAYRLSFDPVSAYYRPLVFYLAILLITKLFGFLCQFLWGMTKYGPETRSTIWNLMDPQQASYTTSQTGPEKVSYWFRDGNRNKKPIVFIHGVGGGLVCYITFLMKLASLDTPIFCIELPFVSMHCVEDVPTQQETVRDLQQMLQRHNFDAAVFVSHSLGTAITSWAVKHMPKSVAGLVFIDPICFMLHYKDVCTNFMYRTPKTAAQGLVKYFASSELYTSYYFSRHFHWFQSVLFVEPNSSNRAANYNGSVTLPLNTKVYLSEHDNIIDSDRVNAYLGRNAISSTIMQTLDHGSFLFSIDWQNEILSTIDKFVS